MSLNGDIESSSMIQRKRQPAVSDSSNDGADSNRNTILHASWSSPSDPPRKRQGRFSATPVATQVVRSLLLVVSALSTVLLLYKALPLLTFLRFATILPVALCFYTGFLRRGRRLEERILPITLLLTVISGQLPVFLGGAIAASATVAFSLATLPRSSRLHRPAPSTSPTIVLLATFLLVAVLLTENFMVWVVSATFRDGQTLETAPPPLQDNGRLVLERFLSHDLTIRQVVSLRRLWNVQWSLVSCLGASFVIVDIYYHPTRQLFSLATRAVVTLTTARLVRTISFLLTVLPSQVRNCYSQHYPNPPPTDLYEWIAVGLIPASHGGCNDLIISGHATVTSTLACVAASVSTDRWFQVALWTLLVLDYAVEIYEGFHYSVDMWLGMVLVTLVWRVLRPIDDHGIVAVSSPPNISEKSTFDLVTAQDVVFYSIPAVIAYLQAVVLPKFLANGVIVLYVGATIILYGGFALRASDVSLQQAYQHYSQHVVLCLLYLALAVYL